MTPWKPAITATAPCSQPLLDQVGVDVADARLGVQLVGVDAELVGEERHGLQAFGLERRGHQRDADLLAGGEGHVVGQAGGVAG